MAAAVLRVGLTGGIGSGKSTVAAMLQALGARLIDTDAISRSLTVAGGAAIDALRAHFGPDSITAAGALDRDWMRERAFADPQLKRQLEAILHPMIGAATEQQAAATGAAPCVVFDVPLLVESGRWRARVDRILVIDAPAEVQIARVLRRSQWTRAAIDQVIAQQASRAARRAAADAVIDNRGDSIETLRADVEQLWACWTGPR
ncbi:dephospho-CoA kinase [uncultured Methylibium sp.]|uniref:dephospho-CoA kinase n=1 Tax=uncultured Methylibium sp. TaxID=381093 RepID=UPI0025E6A77B|nr:dephospho-CoA kinase [uncultured Methylibium sp.]